MASPIRAVGENEKDGREASRRDAKCLGGVSGKRRGYTGRYAKQFNSLLRGLCLWAIVTVSARTPVSVCRSVTRTPDKHARGNWIQLVSDAGPMVDTSNAVFGVWCSGVCALEEFRQMLKAKSTCIIWHYRCTFGKSSNTVSPGLQVIVIEVLCCLFVCGLFNDTVSSLN